MKILCECPGCGKRYRVSEDRAEAGFNCLSCGDRIRIGRPERGRRGGFQQRRRDRGAGMLAALVGGGIGIVIFAIAAWFITGANKPKGPELVTKADGLQYFPAPDPPASPPVAAPDLTRPFADEAKRVEEKFAKATGRTSPKRAEVRTVPGTQKPKVAERNGEWPSGSPLAERPPKNAITAPSTRVSRKGKVIPGVTGWYGRPGYAIRVPSGFSVTDFNDEDEKRFSIDWKHGKSDTVLGFDLRFDASIGEGTRPQIWTGTGSFSGRGEVIVSTGGSESQQIIAGRQWFKVTSSDKSRVTYVAHLEGVRVLVRATFGRWSRDDDVPTVDEIARSFSTEDHRTVTLSDDAFVKESIVRSLPDVERRKNALLEKAGLRSKAPKPDWVQRIAAISKDEQIGISTLPAKYFSIGGDLYEASSGKKLASVPLPGQYDSIAISPEGKHIAVGISSSDSDEPELISIYLTEKPNARPVSIEFDNHPAFAFAGETRLLGGGLSIWGVATGRLIKEKDTGGLFTSGVGPNGRYAAVAAGKQIAVLNVRTGSRAATTDMPTGVTDSVFGTYIGVAFSPDGQELAAIHKDVGLVVWSKHGKVVLQRDLGGRIERMDRGTQTSLQWLPDASGWLIDNQFLMMRESDTIVWELEPARRHVDLYVIVTGQERLLVTNEKSVLAFKIPWDRINDALAALKDDPLLGPGKTVGLSVRVKGVRHDLPEVVANDLRQVLATRLKAEFIDVAADSQLQLLVEHEEKDLGDRATLLQTNMVLKNGEAELWKRKLEAHSGFDRARTAMQLRQKAFGELAYQLAHMRFPGRIAADPELRLPLKTQVPED